MSTAASSAIRLPTSLDLGLRRQARSGARAVDRLLVLDAARVVAAMGVVWFHTIESDTLRASGVLGRFSVAFYTIIAVLFLAEHLERNPDRTFGQYAWARIKRLYLPFLAWTALSLPVLMLARKWDSGLPIPALDYNLLISGATLPLWFIPFVVLATLLAFPVVKWAGRNRQRELMVLAASVGVALFLDLAAWDAPPLQGVPLIGKLLELSWNRWSAIWWGLALAIAYRRWLKDSSWRSLVGALGAVATVGLVATMWRFGMDSWEKVLCGLAFALLTLAPWRGVWVEKLGRYGRLSFGVYFMHMTVILVLRAIANQIHNDGCWQRDVVLFLVTVLVCWGSLIGLERVRALRWLIA